MDGDVFMSMGPEKPDFIYSGRLDHNLVTMSC